MKELGLLYVRTQYYLNGTLVNTTGQMRIVYLKEGLRLVFFNNEYRALEEGDPPTLKVIQTIGRRPSGTPQEQARKARMN